MIFTVSVSWYSRYIGIRCHHVPVEYLYPTHGVLHDLTTWGTPWTVWTDRLAEAPDEVEGLDPDTHRELVEFMRRQYPVEDGFAKRIGDFGRPEQQLTTQQ